MSIINTEINTLNNVKLDADLIHNIAHTLTQNGINHKFYQTSVCLVDPDSHQHFTCNLTMLLNHDKLTLTFHCKGVAQDYFTIGKICYNKDNIVSFINEVNINIPKLRICQKCEKITNIYIKNNENNLCPDCSFCYCLEKHSSECCPICHDFICNDYFKTACNHMFHQSCFKRLKTIYSDSAHSFVRVCPCCRGEEPLKKSLREMVVSISNSLEEMETLEYDLENHICDDDDDDDEEDVDY